MARISAHRPDISIQSWADARMLATAKAYFDTQGFTLNTRSELVRQVIEEFALLLVRNGHYQVRETAEALEILGETRRYQQEDWARSSVLKHNLKMNMQEPLHEQTEGLRVEEAPIQEHAADCGCNACHTKQVILHENQKKSPPKEFLEAAQIALRELRLVQRKEERTFPLMEDGVEESLAPLEGEQRWELTPTLQTLLARREEIMEQVRSPNPSQKRIGDALMQEWLVEWRAAGGEL